MLKATGVVGNRSRSARQPPPTSLTRCATQRRPHLETRWPSCRQGPPCPRTTRRPTSWACVASKNPQPFHTIHTTTRVWSSPAARAADVNAAFADPDIAAILTSIGGEDQIKILRHLDADLIKANPKPFFGSSDNTNLHNYLWNLGIVSYYGGTIMTDLGRCGSVNPHTAEAFRAAFVEDGLVSTCAPARRSPTST